MQNSMQGAVWRADVAAGGGHVITRWLPVLRVWQQGGSLGLATAYLAKQVAAGASACLCMRLPCVPVAAVGAVLWPPARHLLPSP